MHQEAECHVWLQRPLTRPASWFGLLEPAELSRCSSYVQELDLARFVTGRVLARTALGALLGAPPETVRLRTRCAECGGAHGKPEAVGAAAGWELSISHSGEVVAVAVVRGRAVGVDVEEFPGPSDRARGPAPGGLAGVPAEFELVLTDEERTVVAALPPRDRARACLTYWTRKEAVLKATGEGLYTAMTDLGVSPPHAPAALLHRHGPGGGTRSLPALADLPMDGAYHGAVAVLGARSVAVRMHSGAEMLAERFR
ncbi:4'-phosphopantetheinyl transferase family protein [Streptomyces sp. NPDC057682]|uniref:4'-phosphopantetheinyl transferase family protein n=1 Tax=Streptomyces sp. NPDC057682 TaxID=3346210 RepID=UPI0036A5B9DF